MPGANNLHDDKSIILADDVGIDVATVPSAGVVAATETLDLNAYNNLQLFLLCPPLTAGFFNIGFNLLVPTFGQYTAPIWPVIGVGNALAVAMWVPAPVFDSDTGPFWGIRFMVANTDAAAHDVSLVVLAQRTHIGPVRIS